MLIKKIKSLQIITAYIKTSMAFGPKSTNTRGVALPYNDNVNVGTLKK